jgi:tRNA 2-selenouridine synthase
VLVVEDEGRFIGSRDVPLAFYQRMQRSPLVWIDETFEARVTRVLQDYVVGLSAEFVAAHGPDAGFAAFAQRLRDALAHIERRLGGQRYTRLAALLDQALAHQHESGDVQAHRMWITVLLRHYYDPMYDHQREKIASRIVFRGNREEVLAYLREKTDATA